MKQPSPLCFPLGSKALHPLVPAASVVLCLTLSLSHSALDISLGLGKTPQYLYPGSMSQAWLRPLERLNHLSNWE